ncbi:MAG TPA: S41 family peptidase [Candidatus Bathyarchaeia archaeon]|nr:S41 family peptidase [Candidatus Bathyarchaeia archaeon]
MNDRSKVENELDTKKKQLIIEDVCNAIVEKYIDPEVAKKIPKVLLEKYKEGYFDKITDKPIFALEVNKIIKDVCQDKHLHFFYNLEMLETESILLGKNEKKKQVLQNSLIEKAKETNFGFKKLEILDGNIGYLNLIMFHNSDESFETAIAAMNFLQNTNAIIIDLRDNGGGSPEMVQLLSSYFLEGFSQLNYIKRRYGEAVEQYRSMPYVPGKRLLDTRLFLLTSRNTFSAAEDFIYALKCQKKATIIGEQTKGGGHPVDFIPIQGIFLLMLPTGESYNPICQDNWEEIGIKPDISISAELAFTTAYSEALKELISKEKNKTKKLFLELANEELFAKTNELKTGKINLKDLAGEYANIDYGLSKFIFENDKLYWKTNNAGLIQLIPITEKTFIVNEPGFADVSIIFEKNENEILLHIFYKRERDIITKRKV